MMVPSTFREPVLRQGQRTNSVEKSCEHSQRERQRVINACGLLGAGLLSCAPPVAQELQLADTIKVVVERPIFVTTRPLLVIDEAHRNGHTARGGYAPFAALMRAAGFDVRPGRVPFTSQTLRGVSVLVVANASAPGGGQKASAFEAVECDAVRDWVRQGGALWLIFDHRPFGVAAAPLASRFGVNLGSGTAYDEDSTNVAGGRPPVLVYSRENHLLADHAVTLGVDRVIAFTGGSASVPEGAIPVLRFSPTAFEYVSVEHAQKLMDEQGHLRPEASLNRGTPLRGKAQGVILEFGKGRVAVFGEAAMFRLGMDVADNGSRRLALNLAAWLTRAPQ